MISSLCSGEGGGTGQVPTLPQGLFTSATLRCLSLYLWFFVERSLLKGGLLLHSCGQVSISLYYRNMWHREENESYRARRQFSFLDA